MENEELSNISPNPDPGKDDENQGEDLSGEFWSKNRILLAVLGVLLVVGIVFIVLIWMNAFKLPEQKAIHEKIPAPDEEVKEEEKVLHVSLIDGDQIEVEEERMIAVIIENHSDSRPQMEGLADASLVFETEAEGGITRFLAFYPYQTIERVGPVRSARPYFVKWAEQFDAGFAHAGGSDAGLAEIYNSGQLLDLDGLVLEGGDKYFVRDYNYYAPHNLFTNLAELRERMDDLGWDKALKYPFATFGEMRDSAYEEVVSANTIHIYYPFPQYFVRYDYDPYTDTYLRYQAGFAHNDHGSGEQIAPSNVIVMTTNYYPIDDAGRLQMQTEGEGDMYFFRNGKVYTGTWQKSSSLGGLKFYDENDEEFLFEVGKTWISVINYQGGLQWE
ncbi:DUF3048 domain-containing protein [Patescibacteria group bacterium]|nr:DUF3048 domain-containing protein [Patescibacteria group bacterium]